MTALLAMPGATGAQERPVYPDPTGYCDPARTDHDPKDLQRARPPIVLPPGWTSRRVQADRPGTLVFETGPRDSREAVVFMHGNPGNSYDWLAMMRSVPPGARAIAFDTPGFGQADKPWDYGYRFAQVTPWLDAFFAKLGVDRVHLVGHDIGSVSGVEWGSRRPSRLASATIISGGVIIGYEQHYIARVYRTPVAGENFQEGTTRDAFYNEIQRNNPRPLPREFFDRNYDYLDRRTRCAVLKAYRSTPEDTDEFAVPQAQRLRPHDIPALVLWGDKDPFISPDVAHNQRQAFPRADVHVFRQTGHWPFLDEGALSLRLTRQFLGAQIREQSASAVRLTIRPRRIRAGRRVRLRIRTFVTGRPAQVLAGVRVSFAGRKLRTDSRGRATLRTRLRRPGRVTGRAGKGHMRKGRARVRVVR
jgi:pimeloyl-ACP methyl ester carboxylesterase